MIRSKQVFVKYRKFLNNGEFKKISYLRKEVSDTRDLEKADIAVIKKITKNEIGEIADVDFLVCNNKK